MCYTYSSKGEVMKNIFKKQERLPIDIHQSRIHYSPLEKWLMKNVTYVTNLLLKRKGKHSA